MNPASQPDPATDVAPELRSISFHHKPWWQRFLIVLAGPVANFLLAIAIFAVWFAAAGISNTPPNAADVKAGSTADRIGMRSGDQVVSINGERIDSFHDVRRVVSIRPNAAVTITFRHAGTVRQADARLGSETRRDEFGQAYVVGVLGIEPPKPSLRQVSVVEAVPLATKTTFQITGTIVEILGQIVTGERSAREMGGPLRMAQAAGQRASLGFADFVYLLALFSINLGFINLLPVPMLDGGHLVFYAAEAVRRRPVSERAQDWAFRGGLALLLALLVFVTVNDLASFGLFERLGSLIG